MKRYYIKPIAKSLTIEPVQMLAASARYSDTEVDADDSYSSKLERPNPIWGNMEEE